MRQTEMFKQAVLTPAAVANATSAEQTFLVPGLHLGWGVFVNKPTAQAGLVMGGARISAENVLAINFANVTAATITPTASEKYTIVQSQPV